MKIVHCKIDLYDEYVGRPSFFGNPYTVEKHGRGKAVKMFEQMVRSMGAYRERCKPLAGKILACWCAPKGGVDIDGPLICHAQVLARAARGDYDEPII